MSIPLFSRFNRMTLQRQLIFGFVTIVILAVAAISIFASVTIQTDMQEQMIENLEGSAETFSNMLGDIMKQEYNLVYSWAQIPGFKNTATEASDKDPMMLWDTYEGSEWGDDSDELAQPDKANKTIDFTNDLNPKAAAYLLEAVNLMSYAEIFFTDARGYVIASSANTGDFAQKGEDWWDAAMEDGYHLDTFEFDASSQSWSIAISIAIPSLNTTKTGGQYAGVLKAAYDFTSVNHEFEEINIGATGRAMLVSTTGDILATTEDTGVGLDVDSYFTTDISSLLTTDGTITGELSGATDLYNIVAHTVVFDLNQFEYNWKVIVMQSTSEIDTVVQDTVTNAAIAGVVVAFLGVLLSLALTRAILPRIQRVTSIADEIANGNLTIEVTANPNAKDEIGIMENSIAKLKHSLEIFINGTSSSVNVINTTVENLTSGTEEVNASSEEVASTSQAMSNGATTQTELINEVSEEIKSTTKLVDEIIASIRNNTNQVSQIALQTNILALNAGIEASRAGDYGRGFAVVAENIRKLSDQSKAASESITEVADEIAARLEEAFNKISSTMLNVVSVSEETAASAEEVAAAAEEMTSTMSEISEMTMELGTVVEQSSKLIQDFVTQDSEELK